MTHDARRGRARRMASATDFEKDCIVIRPDNGREAIDFQSISTVDEIDYREKVKPAISAPNSEVEDGGKAKRRKLKLIEIKTRALCPKEDNGVLEPNRWSLPPAEQARVELRRRIHKDIREVKGWWMGQHSNVPNRKNFVDEVHNCAPHLLQPPTPLELSETLLQFSSVQLWNKGCIISKTSG